MYSVFFSLPKLAFRLNSPGHEIDAGSQRGTVGWLALGSIDDLPEGHNVTARDPQHGQLRQFLIVRIRGYGASQRIECRAYGVHSRPFPGVRFYPPLASHVLVVSLLTRSRVLPRRLTALNARHRCRRLGYRRRY